MIEELWETLKSIARPSALLGIIGIAIGALTLLISPGLEQYARPLFIAGLILLGVGIVGMLEDIRDLFFAPGTRYSSATVLSIVVFLAIIVVANALVFRDSPRIDVTAAGTFTLSEQTKQILRNLNQDIKVIGFYTGNLGLTRQRTEDLLRQYQAQTPRISYRFVDPETEPALLNQYDVRSDGTVIFESGDKKQAATAADEQSFTSAILKVTAAVQKKIYTVVGHGEREYNDFRDAGFGNLTTALRNDNYEVTDLNLATAQDVPDDAAAIIIADPRLRYQPSGLAALERYLDRGGKLVLLYDGRADIGLKPLLSKYGINYAPEIPPGFIIDPASSLAVDPYTPVVQRYATFDEITRNLQVTFYPRPGAITLPSDTNQPVKPTSALEYDLRVQPIAQTSDRAWIEMTPDRPGRDANEVGGPLNLVVQAQRFIPLGAPRNPDEPVGLRMVVFANADFASNQFIDQFFNREIIVNSVNWVAGDEKLIAIRPKPADNRQLFIAQAQVPFVIISSAVLLPAIVLIAGGVVWYRRR